MFFVFLYANYFQRNILSLLMLVTKNIGHSRWGKQYAGAEFRIFGSGKRLC